MKKSANQSANQSRIAHATLKDISESGQVQNSFKKANYLYQSKLDEGNHWFKNCFYINLVLKKPKDWTSDLDVLECFEKAKQNPKFKQANDRAI
jgi:hypothetical protein